MIDKYILLRLDKDNEQIMKSWLKITKEYAPSGVVCSISMYDDDNVSHPVCLIKKEKTKCFEYVIPLLRSLTEREVAKIVSTFADLHKDLDFEIETEQVDFSNDNVIKIDKNPLMQVASDIEKNKHSEWVRNKTSSGWRYGPKFDAENKTHPLLLPWEHLPSTAKKPDINSLEKFIELLNNQGFSVIDTIDLDKIK